MNQIQLSNLVQQLSQDINKLDEFKEEGGKLIFKKEAENAIIKVIQLKEIIEKVLESIKEGIASSGIAVDPNFKGVNGEWINALYGYYGGKYALKDKKVKPKEFMKKITWEKLDIDLVDEYVKKHNEIPEGIVEREKSLSFRPTESGKEEIQSILLIPELVDGGENR